MSTLSTKRFVFVLACAFVAVLALTVTPAPAEAGWCAYTCGCSSSCSTVCQIATTNGEPGCRTRAECGYQIVDTTCGAYGTCSGSASCASATAEAPEFLELLSEEETPVTVETCEAGPVAVF